MSNDAFRDTDPAIEPIRERGEQATPGVGTNEVIEYSDFPAQHGGAVLARVAAVAPETEILPIAEHQYIVLRQEWREKLCLKLGDYKARLSNFGKVSRKTVADWDPRKKASYQDALFKTMITEAMLAVSSGERVKQSPIFIEASRRLKELGIDLEMRIFFMAWAVIEDYCTTGGVKVFGASGVGDLGNQRPLPANDISRYPKRTR